MKRNEATRAVEQFLSTQRIEWYFEQGGKHLRVVIVSHGRKFYVGLPATTRNHNAGYDTLTRIRRVMRQLETA